MNLISENGVWLTESEFVTSDGKISKAKGKTEISIIGETIMNHSSAELDGNAIVNDYKIKVSNNNRHPFLSKNPALGIQKGFFDVDRNIIYSRFEIENSSLNGFEVVIRNDNICNAHGALYDGNKLINTWTAKLIKAD